MTIEKFEEPLLSTKYLFNLYNKYRDNESGDRREQKISGEAYEKLKCEINRLTVSELNVLKKLIFNMCDFTDSNIEDNRPYEFLCFVLNYLSNTVSYSKSYLDMEDYIKRSQKWPFEFDEDRFNEILDMLSIGELYQTLNESIVKYNEYHKSTMVRCISEMIVKKEGKEEKEKQRVKEELLGNFNVSQEKIITIMFEYLEEQNKMLRKMISDNFERFQHMDSELQAIKDLLGIKIEEDRSNKRKRDAQLQKLKDDMEFYNTRGGGTFKSF